MVIQIISVSVQSSWKVFKKILKLWNQANMYLLKLIFIELDTIEKCEKNSVDIGPSQGNNKVFCEKIVNVPATFSQWLKSNEDDVIWPKKKIVQFTGTNKPFINLYVVQVRGWCVSSLFVCLMNQIA